MGYEDYMKSQRRTNNIRSKAWAHRDKQPWTQADENVILEQWIGTPYGGRDEEAISRELQRTIESCHQRAAIIVDRLGISQRETKAPPARTTYIGHEDDPEDRFWDQDWSKP